MSDGLPILTYHALDRSGHVVSTDPAWFATCMAELHAAGFRTVDLAAWVAAGRPARERTFALAFDDGLASIRLAADVLARHGFCATAFLVPDRMGRDSAWPGPRLGVPPKPLLHWNELADLEAAGFAFGSHSRTHRRLDHLAASELDDELRRSRDEIEQSTGCVCPLVAYPYGLHSGRVRRQAATCYEAAFGTRLDLARPDEDRHAISRIDAYDLRTPRSLERFLSGRWLMSLRLRRPVRATRQFASFARVA